MRIYPGLSDNDHFRGDAKAPVALVEFGDFQCPHCAFAYPIVKSIQALFGHRLTFAFRHFPKTQRHRWALLAATAAEAAGKQNKFWEMHDALFEHHEDLDRMSILGYAEGIGLSLSTLKTDMVSPAIIRKVEDDLKSGLQSNVSGTAVFFINGKRFDYEWTGSELPAYISDQISFTAPVYSGHGPQAKERITTGTRSSLLYPPAVIEQFL